LRKKLFLWWNLLIKLFLWIGSWNNGQSLFHFYPLELQEKFNLTTFFHSVINLTFHNRVCVWQLHGDKLKHKTKKCSKKDQVEAKSSFWIFSTVENSKVGYQFTIYLTWRNKYLCKPETFSRVTLDPDDKLIEYL